MSDPVLGDNFRRVIWTCWFQGLDDAPSLVQRCIQSWIKHNPGWDLRCLDRHTVLHYAPSLNDLNLTNAVITAASLSDIVRINLLHEYGGVWVDASLFCNRPLDAWLPDHMEQGFFAFRRPEPDRPLASWFLAARPHHPIVARWTRTVRDYWRDRRQADDYFWFHRSFRTLCETDPDVAAQWRRVPKVSAIPPHQIQRLGMTSPARDSIEKVDRTLPLFKLTYRYPVAEDGPDSLLSAIIGPPGAARATPPPTQVAPPSSSSSAPTIAGLRLGTENIGDHIQIIAADRLLDRFGLPPRLRIDRDEGLGDPPVPGADQPVPMLMNGWFKRGEQGWPPHAHVDPIFLGFHVRPKQSRALLSPASIAYLRRHQPIGCRDKFTTETLRDRGIDAFESHCLTLTLPRRLPGEGQTRTFVVSRDHRLAEALPASLGPTLPLLHYSGQQDFDRNMARAAAMLALYRDQARLIVTSLLHCALPAIAMGIPVVMFYPINSERGHQSDRERFSSLEQLIPIWRIEDMDQVDWSPTPPDVGAIKLALLDRLSAALSSRGLTQFRALGPIAPASALPPR